MNIIINGDIICTDDIRLVEKPRISFQYWNCTIPYFEVKLIITFDDNTTHVIKWELQYDHLKDDVFKGFEERTDYPTDMSMMLKNYKMECENYIHKQNKHNQDTLTAAAEQLKPLIIKFHKDSLRDQYKLMEVLTPKRSTVLD